MSIIQLKRISKSLPQGGGLFNELFSFVGGESEEVRYFPIQMVEHPTIMTTGTVQIYFTNYPIENIIASSAEWVLWDGFSEIASATTGIRIVPDAALASTVSVTVRTYLA